MTKGGGAELLAHARRLASHSAIYGLADVFSNVVNLLLVPLYTAHLTPRDYGHIALLLLFSTVAKILFRLGLDAGFFRTYFDQDTPERRRRLAGTVLVFSAAVSTLLFAAVVALRGPLTTALLGDDAPTRWWVALAAADVWIGSFAFVPLALLRIEDRPGLFSLLSMVRHLTNIVLKVVLITGGHGVTGFLWSDVASTALFVALLAPLVRGRAAFGVDRPLLRDVLAFGLPKVPHGVLLQVQNLFDRRILDAFVTRTEVGLYQMGSSFGAGVKLASSAFEPAWGPFVYAQARQPDGPRTLAGMGTLAFGAFTTAGLGVAVLGPDLLVLFTPKGPAFHAAAPIVPVVALAWVLHGLFLVTSIGIGIAKEARYYPIVTAAAAGTNVAANLALIPRLGTMGAAWAMVLSYAVMAALGAAFSRRLFPIPFEPRRLLALAATALVAYAAAQAAGGAGLGLPGRLLALLAFPALALGALSAEDRRRLRAMVKRPGGHTT